MANQPSLIPSAWAANNSTTETIPATTTESGKASWDQGFPVETSLPLSEGGIPPKYGDFNGVLNVLSQFCLFAQSGGQYAWNATLDYSVGSIVLGTDGSIYRAAQVSGPSTTAVNPVGDTSGKWERIVSKSDIDALEEDIQDAMDAASDAASNASAAQSAVTTLDANVVKLSGNQNVGGTKTFTDGLVTNGNIATVRTATISGQSVTHNCQLTMNGTSLNYGLYDTTNSKWIIACGPDGKPFFSSTIYGLTNVCLSRDRNDAELTFYGGTTSTDGAIMCLYGGETGFSGQFRMRAAKGGTYRDLIGNYNGNLTWDGNNVITAAGGTMTGFLTRNGDLVKSGSASGQISMYNGSSAADGAGIWLYGKSHSTRPSWINLQTYTTDYRGLIFDGTAFYPTGNTIDLGKNNSTNRWKNEYFQTNPNVSSDERIKSSIGSIPDDVLDAWADVNWSQFQMNDAIEEKGINNARLHTGVVAQRVRDAFSAHDLDATRYGLFCYDEWDAKSEERDEKGEVISEAIPAGNQYSIRYGEALCMEAAYQRRRADRAEARITALERRLDEMEAVLASLMSPVGDETYAEPEQEQDAEQEGEE